MLMLTHAWTQASGVCNMLADLDAFGSPIKLIHLPNLRALFVAVSRCYEQPLIRAAQATGLISEFPKWACVCALTYRRCKTGFGICECCSGKRTSGNLGWPDAWT